jgi:hypothetical protein
LLVGSRLRQSLGLRVLHGLGPWVYVAKGFGLISWACGRCLGPNFTT